MVNGKYQNLGRDLAGHRDPNPDFELGNLGRD